MSGGPELSEVEQPFLDQLAPMGWKVVSNQSSNQSSDQSSDQSPVAEGRLELRFPDKPTSPGQAYRSRQGAP